MAQETKVAEKTCLIPTFERNRYFFGKPLRVHDFEAEQQYNIGKSRLLNRLIHGTGLLCGMQLSKPKIADGKFTVEISEGAALDCCGNLIVANATETVEVKGALVEGKNYLYVKFAECVRQPIMATANVSSCEEVCCYNRIRESFEIFATSVSPELPAVSNSGIVPPEELSAKSPGGSAKAKKALPQSEEVELHDSQSVRETLCNEVTQKYFEAHSRACPRCDDPRVFLAVVTINDSTVSFEPHQDETRRIRSVVFTNPMLQDLLCDHLADFNNPHHTTAAQVKALQTINGVGNAPGQPYTANVNLVSNNPATIVFTPDSANKRVDLKLAPDAVKPVHLNNDTINGLLTSDGTITIQPNPAGKSIAIKTKPATDVTSVGTKAVGASLNFARQDHSHDLANNAVTSDKLAEAVISTLIASDGTITVTPDLPGKQIRIRTNPAAEVTSVGTTKSPGNSLDFARGNHIHDLAANAVTKPKLAEDVISTLVAASDNTITVTADLAGKQIKIKSNLQINEKRPDANGKFRLTAGENIQIGGGAPNELIISAGRSGSSGVTTGVVPFNNVKPAESRASGPISHGLDTDTFAIILGLELTGNAIGPASIEIGDFFAIGTQAPLLVARYTRGAEVFVVHLRDTRSASGQGTAAYVVRWWAIPSTDEKQDVGPQPEPDKTPATEVNTEALDAVVKGVQSQPGSTTEELAKFLKMSPEELLPLVNHLKADGWISEQDGRLFWVIM